MALVNEPAPEGETLEFMKRLWALAEGLDIRSKRMLATFGVTGPQRLVIRAIGRHPRITPGAVAATLEMHPSTLTGILRRLQERRFIARRRDPTDRRRTLLVLTARGMQIDRERRGTVEAAVGRALGRRDGRRIEITSTLLRSLAEELLRE